MQMLSSPPSSSPLVTFAFGLGIALGLSCPVYLLGRAIIRAVPSSEVLKVRGVAQEEIELDRVDWTITVEYMRPTVEAAYAEVNEGVDRVVEYLEKKGIAAAALRVGPHQQSTERRYVKVDKLGNQELRLEGYRVSRQIQLLGYPDIDRLESVERGFSADLRRTGTQARPGPLRYGLRDSADELKARLLDLASRNAFRRAESIAKSSGAHLGRLRAARQGAFTGFDGSGRVRGGDRRHRIGALVTVDYSVQ